MVNTVPSRRAVGPNFKSVIGWRAKVSCMIFSLFAKLAGYYVPAEACQRRDDGKQFSAGRSCVTAHPKGGHAGPPLAPGFSPQRIGDKDGPCSASRPIPISPT